MPTIRHINNAEAPLPAGAYSQGVVAGGFLYTAGFGPHDPESGIVVGTDIATQTRQTLSNIASVLRTQGLDLSHVVKATVHLADVERDFAAYDAVYHEVMPAPYPARTTVGSGLLRILVEIDVVAALP
jgi:reactive intermediate/imine deaminase